MIPLRNSKISEWGGTYTYSNALVPYTIPYVAMIFFTETISVLTKGQQLEFSQQIKYMVNIDSSCNNLTGEIPQGISALITLKSLNLSWNRLSGRIPNNIGSVKALTCHIMSYKERSLRAYLL